MMDEQGTRFAVLLEDMNRNLGVLAEAVAVQTAESKALKSNFERLDSRFGEMTFEMRELKKTVSQLSTQVDRLESFATDAGPRLERIETKVDKLETKVDKLETKVDKLETKVDKLETKVDKLEVFASDAGPRLVRLEGKFDNLEAFAGDAGPRLVRIETHLALPVLPPRREKTRLTPSKHHRRKPTKRN